MIRVLITLPTTVPGEIETLENVRDDFDKIHLRKNDWSEAETGSFLESCSWGLRQRLILCDHFNLFFEYQTGGIHLKEHMRETTENLSQYRKGTISSSFHDFHSLRKEMERFDYALFGPVFPSFSKQGYLPRYSEEDVRNELSQRVIKAPVIGIGGVDESKVSLLEDMGFSGYAVLTSFWKSHVS